MAAEQDRFLLIVKIHKARDLKWKTTKALMGFTKMRPFASVLVGDKEIKLGNTAVAKSSDEEPTWNESFFLVTSEFMHDTMPHCAVKINVRDYGAASTYIIGHVILHPPSGSADGAKPVWHKLKKKEGNGEILVSAVSVPMSQTFKLSHTPSADFGTRNNCSVRLYQDARCPSLIPEVPDRNCFEDMHESISGAKKFIYITGWSVWTKILLIRQGKPCLPLGELLIEKANQGVQVCVMIWDEYTSFESHKDDEAETGMMGTYDEETRNFFKGTAVAIQAMFRSGHMGTEEAIFTHHQKTIICDSDDKVIAYVGGLDVTGGRYDTPDHQLFTTLDTDHEGDFYNGCVVTAAAETGPREPWHDIHSRYEGAVAIDVYENFRQRWVFDPTDHNSNLGAYHGKEWVAPEKLLDVASMDVSTEGNWNCQLLRSISGYSMDVDKDMSTIVRSIHNSYVLRIGAAQRYVYLENQYFMGSSHFWAEAEQPGLRNLVAITIVEKIVSKIAANEDFCAYIIIPMFPEGAPESMGVQTMLYWQYRTYQMMLKRISKALRKHGREDKTVEDYLVLMCLATKQDASVAKKKGKHGSMKHGRHMVYVHSKMLIVDDEHILIGSANINDRSMRGNRDTEIAVISNQRTGDEYAHSQDIQNFRHSLWTEHFGNMDDRFREPSSAACNQHVRAIATKNWENFANDDAGATLVGHACRYPYVLGVGGKGNVKVVGGDACFPDNPTALIKGAMSVMPNDITT